MRVSLIVAMAKNRVIGVGNRLPWSLPEDLKHFRATTLGHTVIMGRKTFESIGRALPGRKNSVISRGMPVENLPEGIHLFRSLSEALKEAESHQETEAFIIGGAQLYREAIPRVQRIYLTRIDQEFPGDAFMPEWDESRFHQIKHEERQLPFPHAYLILDLKKME